MIVKITRLITNQLIIGKTSNEGDIFIEDPYEVLVTQEGIGMIPMDEHILGIKLGSITIDAKNVIYSQEPSGTLKSQYLETVSGIEIPEKKLIL